MNKYQTQAKIYAIRSHHTDEFYIGSTCDTLPKRFYNHKSKFKSCQNGNKTYYTSYKMFEYGDAYIELLEMCPCNNKMELTRREGELIRANPNCVNKNIAGRTRKQYKQDNIEAYNQYYQDNAEKLKDYHKQYHQDNAEKIKAQQKQYRQDNPEKIKAIHKQYQQANAEKIKARQNQKHDCDCGGKYTTIHKARHLKTKKHQNYLETL